jgi:hypothetical protein
MESRVGVDVHGRRVGAVRGRFGEFDVGGFAFTGGQRLDVDRRQRRFLHDLEQLFLRQLEDGQEGHHHAQLAFLGIEQAFEAVELAVTQLRQHLAHALADTQGFALDRVVGEQLGALEHVAQGQQHLAQVHRRRHLDRGALGHVGVHDRGVAVQAVEVVDVLGGLLETLVFLQAAHQLGARVAFQAFFGRRAGQQHARLDLGQDGGHDQVFGGELEAQLLHHFDVVHVLPGDLGDRDVQDVQVLAADQVEQQVERAFEGLQDDFQRVRRDVQVLRHLQHRLAQDHRQRHFLLLGRHGKGRMLRFGRGVFAHRMLMTIGGALIERGPLRAGMVRNTCGSD